MNDSIDLTKILNVSDKVRCIVHGEGTVVANNQGLISVSFRNSPIASYTSRGLRLIGNGLLFPIDQKLIPDWSLHNPSYVQDGVTFKRGENVAVNIYGNWVIRKLFKIDDNSFYFYYNKDDGSYSSRKYELKKLRTFNNE